MIFPSSSCFVFLSSSCLLMSSHNPRNQKQRGTNVDEESDELGGNVSKNESFACPADFTLSKSTDWQKLSCLRRIPWERERCNSWETTSLLGETAGKTFKGPEQVHTWTTRNLLSSGQDFSVSTCAREKGNTNKLFPLNLMEMERKRGNGIWKHGAKWIGWTRRCCKMRGWGMSPGKSLSFSHIFAHLIILIISLSLFNFALCFHSPFKGRTRGVEDWGKKKDATGSSSFSPQTLKVHSHFFGTHGDWERKRLVSLGLILNFLLSFEFWEEGKNCTQHTKERDDVRRGKEKKSGGGRKLSLSRNSLERQSPLAGVQDSFFFP